MARIVEENHSQPAPKEAKADPEARTIETDDSARQGPKGRPVLMVLLGSLVLLAIYMGALLIWSGSQSPDNPSQNASREAVTGSPSGSTSNPSKSTPPANPAYPVPANPSATGSTGSQPNQ
jgi:hypothetical protein